MGSGVGLDTVVKRKILHCQESNPGDPAHSMPLHQLSYKTKKQTPWPQSKNKLYRLSDRCLSAILVPTFADRGVSRSQRGRSPAAVILVS
jgi:hypothetical protein